MSSRLETGVILIAKCSNAHSAEMSLNMEKFDLKRNKWNQSLALRSYSMCAIN
jgi:hypothetical protein